MKQFLKQIALGFAKLAVAFLLLAVAARFVEPLNWLFFQKNDHNDTFYTLLAVENSLAKQEHFDIVIFGSSVAENAIDPYLLSELTGMSVFKFVTGAQSIDMSVGLARFLAPKWRPKYIIIDAYPRFGGGLTEEGVERALINTPNANSDLAKAIWAVDPSSFTTYYLWLARRVGTFVKPYDEKALVPKPQEFEILGPGFTHTTHDPPSVPEPFRKKYVEKVAIECLNDLHKELKTTDQELIAILTPLQNAVLDFETKPDFPFLRPLPRPDTCFFDDRHMRGACIRNYTIELAEKFNQLRQETGNGASKSPTIHP